MTETSEEIERLQSKILNWSMDNYRDFTWRETSDPYEVLVAEMLLQRTDSNKVEDVYQEFLGKYSDLDDLSVAEEDDVASILEPLGLHNKRAEALVAIGGELRGRGVPDTEVELLELPLVGKYCANATLCFAFEQDRAIVDRNVIRIYERFFDKELDYQSTETWEFAESVLPENDVERFNLALLDFSSKVCVDGTPKCDICPLTGDCCYYGREKE